MASQNYPTKEFIDAKFFYKDGILYRKSSGKKAGNMHKLGYMRIWINGKSYYSHRLIFIMFYGFEPKYIDHIDGNPKNNKIENLREAKHQENMWNRKIPTTNKSGYKNVSWHKTAKKWSVCLTVNGKQKYFGTFEDLELAGLVAQEARNKYFGRFAMDF